MRWLAGQLVTVVGQAVIVAVRVEKIVEVVNPPDPPLLLLGADVGPEEPVIVAKVRIEEALETPDS